MQTKKKGIRLGIRISKPSSAGKTYFLCYKLQLTILEFGTFLVGQVVNVSFESAERNRQIKQFKCCDLHFALQQYFLRQFKKLRKDKKTPLFIIDLILCPSLVSVFNFIHRTWKEDHQRDAISRRSLGAIRKTSHGDSVVPLLACPIQPSTSASGIRF